jgi:DNA repair protein SbcD/Mre11
VKFLHTSDWHIGKVLRGADRREEQAAVLREIATIAVNNDVDAVLIAGDVYENLAPTAEAQALVVQTLMALGRRKIEVVLIAGNHDHGGTIEAYKPLMGAVGIQVFGLARPADRGGVHTFRARSTGERVNVAVLPFLSQRYAVRAYDIVNKTPAQNVGAYDELLRGIVTNLSSGFTDDGVNLFMAHLTCTNATFGGGERPAQSIFEYHVPAAIFPPSTHYVALGHLHRRQQVPAACPVHYSGSPLPVDFGEQDNKHVVCLVEASPGTPARVTDIPVRSGRRLRTVEGTAAELIANVASYGSDYLRLVVKQATFAGMKDELQDAVPNVLQIQIHRDFAATAGRAGLRAHGPTKSPAELFSDYCAEVKVSDDRVLGLFNRLHDELSH